MLPMTPINCACKTTVAYFSLATGVIQDSAIPATMSVFAAYINCPTCNRWFKFNGEKMRRKAQQKQKA